MTQSGLNTEQIALDGAIASLRSEGYEVIPEPGRNDLPPFLADLRPDAIATGKHPSLLVEVFPKRGERQPTKIERLRSLLLAHDDWELRIFYSSSPELPLAPVSNDIATGAIQAARNVATTEPKAALLLAWSAVEAVAREKIETTGSRALNPSALVNLLVSEGYIDQTQAKQMFDLSKIRMQVAHGQLDCETTANDVEWILSIADQIAGG